MSTTLKQIPYEEALVKIANLETSLLEFKNAATKHGEEDKTKDKEMEASFKQAQTDMKKDDKEHKATMDENDKVKDAFKIAEDETDPEKKKMAMKRAMEMKHDNDDKHARKAEEHPREDIDKQPQKEASITEVIYKKVPLINKILEATRIFDPSNYDKREKELFSASLEQVQNEYEKIAPYLGAVGVGSKISPTASQGMGMIPFLASSVSNGDALTNPTNLYEASVEDIDFTKISTKQLMEMRS